MPHFSAFTAFGHFRFSQKASSWESVYRASISALGAENGKSYSVAPGTHEEATVYCRAQMVARARGLLERADNQRDPATVLEMLPSKEAEYKIVVRPGQTIQQRRAALIATAKLNRGATFENITDQLTQALGADFLAYRVVTETEQTLWPTDPSVGPGVYPRPELPTKLVRLVGGNAAIGSSWASYGNVDTSADPVLLQVGDKVCANAGDLANAEKVTVTGTRTTVLGVTQFQATFTLYHPFGAIVTTGPFPAQFSTRRFAWMIVSNAASVDLVRRAKVHEVMRRAARGVSAWAIVRRVSSTQIGPFVPETSPLGATPSGTITI